MRHRDPSSTLTLWLVRLFGWDGLLPLAVLFVPLVISTLVGRGAAREVAAVVTPVVAYLWRASLGLKSIATNRCSIAAKRFQYFTLFVGLLLLLLIDAFTILIWAIPPGGVAWGDFGITAILYVVYLFLMAISLFPGRAIS